MPALRVVRVTGGQAGKLRVVNITAAGTSVVNPRLRVVRITATGTPKITLAPITNPAPFEPGKPVSIKAVLEAGGTGSVTWSWTQLSGPPVTLSGTATSTVTFASPSVMPGDDPDVVLSVTATTGGVTSEPRTVVVTTLPQTRWSWDGTKWVGASRTPL